MNTNVICVRPGVRAVSISNILKPWSSPSGRVVILGDAAHAMAPFLGQGANQALQDSYAVASCVSNINRIGTSASIKDEMNKYEWKRKFRTGSGKYSCIK